MFLISFIISSTLFISVIYLVLRIYVKLKKKNEFSVGFFHPYCNAGGGGERVLWCAIKALQFRYPYLKCVIYTGDIDATADEILSKAKKTFNLAPIHDVQFVFLKKRFCVEAKMYPVLTLLGQSIGSMVLGFEALLSYTPNVYIDTMGYAFTLPIFKYLGKCTTGSYVHYPTISTDMLNVVKCQNDSFNNRKVIAKSYILTQMKLFYYKAFAFMYGKAGGCSDTVMVNSSWTNNHIKQLWKVNTHRVFPPSDIRDFLEFPLERADCDCKVVLSIAQFRPEKNHTLQILSFKSFLSNVVGKNEKYKLMLVGGCRNKGDEERVEKLKQLAEDLNIKDSVEIKTNVSYSELTKLLSQATVGIHTMENEHFGIGIVEFQASGVITLAHNSGGPKMDIVQPPGDNDLPCTGYLASDVDTYKNAMLEIFQMSQSQRNQIAESSRISCERFSECNFCKGFIKATNSIMRY